MLTREEHDRLGLETVGRVSPTPAHSYYKDSHKPHYPLVSTTYTFLKSALFLQYILIPGGKIHHENLKASFLIKL